MTRGRSIAFGVVGLVAVGLVVAWFLTTFERKTVDLPLPPKGEAIYNPLYALKAALGNDRQRVVARPHLIDAAHPLRPGDTVVLLADTARLTPREVEALYTHVMHDGHLVVQATASMSEAASIGGLLTAFEVGDHAFVDDRCMHVSQPRETPDPVLQLFARGLMCGDRFALNKGAEPVVAWGDDAGYAFARFGTGEGGSIDVVATLDPARNANLSNEDNRVFVRQLLQPNWNRGTFHLVYADEMPSLWRLLAEHAWRALVALALCILAWLWMRTQRFGPRLPSPPEERRSLLDHVQATGDHLYRYGRAHLLHAALRAHVLARLRRVDPIAAALEGQAQVDRLAERTGLPATDIADALRSPRPFDAKDFRHRIARLIALGRHT